MDTDRVISLLQLRRKVLTMHGNIIRADPVDDSMGITYMGMSIDLDGEQFAAVRPVVVANLTRLVHAIDHQLQEQGVMIK